MLCGHEEIADQCPQCRPSYEERLENLLKMVRCLVYYQKGSGVTLYHVQQALEELEGKRTDV